MHLGINWCLVEGMKKILCFPNCWVRKINHLGKWLLRQHSSVIQARKIHSSMTRKSCCTTGNHSAHAPQIPSSDFENSPGKFYCLAANSTATVKPDKPVGNEPYSTLEENSLHNWSTMKICEKQLQCWRNRFGSCVLVIPIPIRFFFSLPFYLHSLKEAWLNWRNK